MSGKGYSDRRLAEALGWSGWQEEPNWKETMGRPHPDAALRPIPKYTTDPIASEELVAYMTETLECEFTLETLWFGNKRDHVATFTTHRGAFIGRGWREAGQTRQSAIALAALGLLTQGAA